MFGRRWRWFWLTALLPFAAAGASANSTGSGPPAAYRERGASGGVWFWTLPDTPNGLKPTQSWSGAGPAPGGEIFVAGMDHRTNAALYRLQPGDDPAAAPGPVLIHVGNARAASEAVGNWEPGEVAEKFHTRPTWHGSRVYVATLSHSRLDDGYTAKRGFHWYAYDLADGVFRDLSAGEEGGTGARHGGLVSIAIDGGRAVIYGAMLPTGDIYAYDIAAGTTRRIGRPEYGRAYVYAGRAMWLDRRGRLYFTAGNPSGAPASGGPYDPAIFNHVRYYDPETGLFGARPDWRLHDQRAVDAARCLPEAGVCYLSDNAGHVYRFSEAGPDGPRWEHVGSIGQRTTSEHGRNWVFQVGDSGDRAYLLTSKGRLFVMDLSMGDIVSQLDFFELEPSLRGLQLYGFDAWDSNGRFYFAAFGRPGAPFNARLVAVDPDRLAAAEIRGFTRATPGGLPASREPRRVDIDGGPGR